MRECKWSVVVAECQWHVVWCPHAGDRTVSKSMKTIATIFVVFPALILLSKFGEPSTSVKTKAVTSQESNIERMKKCAHQAKKDRQRWFFDETGIAVSLDLGSSAAQAYNDEMKAAGIATKTPLPFRDCSASALQ